MRLSLYWKIILAFAAVITATIGAVTLVAGQSTRSEFSTYMSVGRLSRLEQAAAVLAEFYAARGSWSGVESLLRTQTTGPGHRGQGGETGEHGQPSGVQGGGVMQRLRLADTRGVIVADTGDVDVGRSISQDELQTGFPIVVNQQTVGTLLAEPGPNVPFGQQEQDMLNRINRGLLLGGLAAGLLALVVGFLVFRNITAPLSRLTNAVQAVAKGDLSARVPITTQDEIARVGQAFNTMATSLQQAALQRRNMMADIAHELRTPLSVIQGNLEAIRDGVYPADDEHLEPTLDQAHLLARLVEDLRTLALAESGQLALNKQAADLGTLIQRTVASFDAQARQKRITLAVQSPADLPPAHVDSQRIAQVIGNLLENALRYTPEEGHINVTLSASPPPSLALQVSIADSGPGISPENLAHVFDRFYRADKSRSRQGGGSGLGLSIAKGIAEAHGGTIRAESAPGRGATFVVELPVAQH